MSDSKEQEFDFDNLFNPDIVEESDSSKSNIIPDKVVLDLGNDKEDSEDKEQKSSSIISLESPEEHVSKDTIQTDGVDSDFGMTDDSSDDLDGFNGFSLKTANEALPDPDELTPGKIGGYDILDEQDEDIKEDSDELNVDIDDQDISIQYATDMYSDLNDSVVGKKDNIPDGYPKLIVTVKDNNILNKRQFTSLNHFLEPYKDDKEIEDNLMLRLELKYSSIDKLMGLIYPQDIKTILSILDNCDIKAQLSESKFLEGKQILALSV